MSYKSALSIYNIFLLDNQCPATHFQCANGACIPLNWKCDSKSDCHDNSDELPSLCANVKTCTDGQFQCRRTQQCIPSNWVCDGEKDCGADDTSDEDSVNCRRQQKCLPNQSECDGGLCLDTEKFCDGKFDCVNDEWVENCRKRFDI